MKQSSPFHWQNVENAVLRLCTEIDSDQKSIRDWRGLPENELWLEIVSCILGSRVRSETASVYFNSLKDKELLDIRCLLKRPEESQQKIATALKSSVCSQNSESTGSAYPFPNIKSASIVKTGVEIYLNSNTTIRKILKSSTNPCRVRMIVVSKCHGIGLKQASLFLRNILFCDNLAILDTHVMRFINVFLIGGHHKINNTKYLIYERILQNYAASKRVSLATLDLAIWVVMRLLRREFGYEYSQPSFGRH